MGWDQLRPPKSLSLGDRFSESAVLNSLSLGHSVGLAGITCAGVWVGISWPPPESLGLSSQFSEPDYLIVVTNRVTIVCIPRAASIWEMRRCAMRRAYLLKTQAFRHLDCPHGTASAAEDTDI